MMWRNWLIQRSSRVACKVKPIQGQAIAIFGWGILARQFMAVQVLDPVLSKRFKLEVAPGFEARLSGTAPIRFTRLTTWDFEKGRSTQPPPENAFSFMVPLIDVGFTDLRLGSKSVVLPRRQEAGQPFLFDLSSRPSIGIDSSFDLLRFYISQATIDELAYEKGLKRVGGLAQPSFGEKDPIVFRMAQILAIALESPNSVSDSFVEYMALAFHEHIIHQYGGSSVSTRPSDARLAPWQIRRVTDYVETNLESNPSISDLANMCELSPSYFALAFRQMMGMAPHQWLMRRRVERAKAMLKTTNAGLAIVSTSCGFFDQSHFSRVFSRFEGYSPREWRRLNKE
ncbi:AraC family transcriptional regulator [Mesorhizobium sp. B2-1-8]|uniref:helix-turn-helix domain-containing protein n=1 Tax=Mesorhizobium sp. B2-1-8 TaxID=2589967 RepID=UPI0015E3962B|nr:AraC family transcriptional regulator [Mesorhizobium sp. B2-1-8]UCI17895.1 AraC family transcriptional regulator [Mesorhizobium sp. B2-1-8]